VAGRPEKQNGPSRRNSKGSKGLGRIQPVSDRATASVDRREARAKFLSATAQEAPLAAA
jgi:hypothetical protein